MIDEVYLAQTDTTVGFLSSSKTKLNRVKNRPENKQFLITTTTFKTLKSLARVPKRHKKMVRRAKKTTFIYQNEKAVRVIKESSHDKFLKKFNYLYSTSANESGKSFDKDFAFSKADIIVEDRRGFSEENPSKLIKLSKKLKKKLR
jgi:tRNA A37 threonylcarbamoyladenosine synthetase subunit TsaC/SUA5/YrdC